MQKNRETSHIVFAPAVALLLLLAPATPWGALPAHAAVLHVPNDYPTIQAAVDAAADGDTVLAAAGVYRGEFNRDIDPEGKPLVIMSESGPERCIIDCEQNGRGFIFQHGETPATVVRGFTIRNGLLACLT